MRKKVQVGMCLLKIPQDILDTARLTVEELKSEMAVFLYAQGRISLVKRVQANEKLNYNFNQIN